MQHSNEIPEHTNGVQTDTEYSVNAKSRSEAEHIFKRASARLLQINTWHKLCGPGSAHFALTDKNGQKVMRPAKENDYFKIDIPGPGSAAGDGYDWVRVEKIKNKISMGGEEENLMMQVRPCSAPAIQDDSTAHFLSDEATSTFIIARENNTIKASVHGRNEKPNVEAENFIDKLRNAVMGTGAIAGAAKIQWTLLVKGLLAEDV